MQKHATPLSLATANACLIARINNAPISWQIQFNPRNFARARKFITKVLCFFLTASLLRA
jgi:hypothetical protein